ncbi:MAG: phosphoribosylglycinamide formyltransferase [Pseudomonadales bacterium]|nr:phosphoribosylglycinamide formyltransferase [Pseudomonadales bacterium]
MKKTASIVVLISGSGSNLQSIIDACQSDQINGRIKRVISNRPKAFGLQRANEAGIDTLCIDHTEFDSRSAFDAELAKSIKELNPDIVVLAGFMRILTPEFVNIFEGKLLNIHPSLLPKYPGLNTHQRAIDDGQKKAGVTVHFVTAELDGGPSILQAEVPINNNDNADTLAAKVLIEEHKIYPQVVAWLAEERLKLIDGGAVLDQHKLPENGYKAD